MSSLERPGVLRGLTGGVSLLTLVAVMLVPLVAAALGLRALRVLHVSIADLIR